MGLVLSNVFVNDLELGISREVTKSPGDRKVFPTALRKPPVSSMESVSLG